MSCTHRQFKPLAEKNRRKKSHVLEPVCASPAEKKRAKEPLTEVPMDIKADMSALSSNSLNSEYSSPPASFKAIHSTP